MKIIYNKFIPFKGFKAVNLFGVVFVRNGKSFYAKDRNHELIHTYQMKEMLYVFFYIWYLIEYCVRLIQYRNFHTAYKNISFEREAYGSQYNDDYLGTRKAYAWFRECF